MGTIHTESEPGQSGFVNELVVLGILWIASLWCVDVGWGVSGVDVVVEGLASWDWELVGWAVSGIGVDTDFSAGEDDALGWVVEFSDTGVSGLFEDVLVWLVGGLNEEEVFVLADGVDEDGFTTILSTDVVAGFEDGADTVLLVGGDLTLIGGAWVEGGIEIEIEDGGLPFEDDSELGGGGDDWGKSDGGGISGVVNVDLLPLGVEAWGGNSDDVCLLGDVGEDDGAVLGGSVSDGGFWEFGDELVA